MLACAQIYKCVDGGGRTTYQQAPCPSGQQGREIAVTTDNGSSRGPETDAGWERAAREKRIVSGMPKNWVTQALGTPVEARPARAGEGGTEVWVYELSADVLRVGFIGNNVAWQRREPRPSRVREDGPRNVGSRAKVAAGQDCTEVMMELGNPDREEPADGSGGRADASTGPVRYRYEPVDGDMSTRLAFTCLSGRVMDVERTLAR